MKRSKWILICMLFSGCASGDYFPFPTPMARSVYIIERYDGIYGYRGTAFVIKKDKQLYLVTARHNILGKGDLILRRANGTPVRFSQGMLHTKPGADVAVLEIYSNERLRILELSKVDVNRQVTMYGFPPGGLYKSDGKVVVTYLGMSNIVMHGMSGGPAIQDGKVVGMVSSIVEHGGRIKSIAISSNMIESLLPR